MIVTAWNNGSYNLSGGGYGVKISARDRDRYFCRKWGVVEIEVGSSGQIIEVNIEKDSFWNEECRELISKQIGEWLISKGHRYWADGEPPKFALEPLSANRFRLGTIR